MGSSFLYILRLVIKKITVAWLLEPVCLERRVSGGAKRVAVLCIMTSRCIFETEECRAWPL